MASHDLFFAYGDSQMASFELPADFESARLAAKGSYTKVVNAAVSGATTTMWLPSSDPSSYYQQALTAFRASMAIAPNAPKAFLCSLGTNDAHTSGSPADWKANMNTTLSAFRADLGLNLPLVYTVMPTTVPTVFTPPAWDNWANIRAMQMANGLPGSTGVQMPEGTWRDGLHFDAATNLNVIAPSMVAASP